VVTLPARAVSGTARGTVHTLRTFAVNEVDDWGRDPSFVERVTAVSRDCGGTSPSGAPNTSPSAPVPSSSSTPAASRSHPLFAALAIGDATGRPVRFVGRPDIAPFGPLLQRLGGLLPIAPRSKASAARR
jgi:hypothetical protein